ncbi:DUF3024 domain-containing protein [Flavihumibacter sp. CACIAM 22H1]|uniref:DUF3024 domain-containing protein n=1 Tax=Flavihumibacter sp. CACIAM 22H1 TaxID=1812911 RepID=UPI0007A86BDC|nr:DUF3024 domain-containing protein [Flavihumibacter sp. CACIAM 22H1]KYP15368.1 MAG: hypothetical protein A1D16_16425 [Flavihumibacter sp. CACIAM 22H1]
MPLTLENTVDIIETMENYIDRVRPPLAVRSQLDIGYSIENQSVVLFEIRPAFHNPTKMIESPYAKANFVKKENHWKVYWMRGNLSWDLYDPQPIAKTLKQFLDLVDRDEHHCFKG